MWTYTTGKEPPFSPSIPFVTICKIGQNFETCPPSSPQCRRHKWLTPKEKQQNDWFKALNEDDDTAKICITLGNTVDEITIPKRTLWATKKKVNRNTKKVWWRKLGWSSIQASFKGGQGKFDLTLQRIEEFIVKLPWNMVLFPIEPHHQLAITLHWCAYGCIFLTVTDFLVYP